MKLSLALFPALAIPVNCDRSRIGQLVSNLVGNALSHGASNEPVRLRAATEDGVFTLTVANSGEPIPKAAIRLFEPFFRGEVLQSARPWPGPSHCSADSKGP